MDRGAWRAAVRESQRVGPARVTEAPRGFWATLVPLPRDTLVQAVSVVRDSGGVGWWVCESAGLGMGAERVGRARFLPVMP